MKNELEIHSKSSKIMPGALQKRSWEQVGFRTAFFGAHPRLFGAILGHLGDFGAILGPSRSEGGFKKTAFFITNQHKVQKNEVQEGIAEKHDFWTPVGIRWVPKWHPKSPKWR